MVVSLHKVLLWDLKICAGMRIIVTRYNIARRNVFLTGLGWNFFMPFKVLK